MGDSRHPDDCQPTVELCRRVSCFIPHLILIIAEIPEDFWGLKVLLKVKKKNEKITKISPSASITNQLCVFNTSFSEFPLRCSMNPSKFMKASAPMSKGSKLYWKCFNVQCRWCYSIFVIFVSQISKHLMFRRLNVALSKAEGQRTKSCKNWKPRGRFKENLRESLIRYLFSSPAALEKV